MIKVFDSHEDFLKREDKTVAGVSKAFAKHRPDYLDVFDVERHGGTWNFWKGTGCWKCHGKEWQDAMECRWCGGVFAERRNIHQEKEVVNEEI